LPWTIHDHWFRSFINAEIGSYLNSLLPVVRRNENCLINKLKALKWKAKWFSFFFWTRWLVSNLIRFYSLQLMTFFCFSQNYSCKKERVSNLSRKDTKNSFKFFVLNVCVCACVERVKISNLSDGLVRKIGIFPSSNIYLSDFCLECNNFPRSLFRLSSNSSSPYILTLSMLCLCKHKVMF
jgi:hypothetical protein